MKSSIDEHYSFIRDFFGIPNRSKENDAPIKRVIEIVRVDESKSIYNLECGHQIEVIVHHIHSLPCEECKELQK
jgi:hypothetical protein